MKPDKKSYLTLLLFAVYFLLLTGVILFKLPFYSPELSDGIRVVNLVPFQGSFDENGVIVWREIIQNTLLFIPLGIYICMIKEQWPFKKKVMAIFALTMGFEIIQFIFAMGRSDITDILDNTFGGIIGIVIYSLLFKLFEKRTVKIANIIALTATVYVVMRFSQLFYLSHFVMRRLHL